MKHIILFIMLALASTCIAQPTKKMIAATETMTISDWHSDIPADAELVYIEAISAEQWVQTGIVFDPTMGYEIKFATTQDPGKTWQCTGWGAYGWSRSCHQPQLQWYNSGKYFQISFLYPGATTATQHKIELPGSYVSGVPITAVVDSSYGIIVNGVQMFEGEPTYGTDRFAYFTLFGLGRPNDITAHSSSQLAGNENRRLRIYSFKMWDADKNLLCNYVPCLQDDVACFYDRVTGTFVGSAGSIPLIPGPVRTR